MKQPTLAFENATQDTIECGDIVETVSGFIGQVYRIANNRYFLAQRYRMSSGNYIAVGRARQYAFEYEIAAVLAS